MKQAKELRIDAKLYAGGAAGFAIPSSSRRQDAASMWSAPRSGRRSSISRARNLPTNTRQSIMTTLLPGASAYAALFVTADASTARRTGRLMLSATRSRRQTLRPPTAGEVRDKEGYQNQNFHETFAIQVQKGEFETVWPKSHASKPYVYPVPSWKDRK